MGMRVDTDANMVTDERQDTTDVRPPIPLPRNRVGVNTQVQTPYMSIENDYPSTFKAKVSKQQMYTDEGVTFTDVTLDANEPNQVTHIVDPSLQVSQDSLKLLSARKGKKDDFIADDKVFYSQQRKKNAFSVMVKRQPITSDLAMDVVDTRSAHSKNSNEQKSKNRRIGVKHDNLRVRKTDAYGYALNVSVVDGHFSAFDHKKARELAEEKKEVYERTKKRKLLDKSNKKRKWKKFSRMNPDEKKERVSFLWEKVRHFVKQIRFVKATQFDIDQQFLNQFAQETSFNDTELVVKAQSDLD